MTNEQQKAAEVSKSAVEQLVKRIAQILDERPSCLCGSRESCEACNPYSEYNRLRNRLIEVIIGPKPTPDYETVIIFDRDEITGA